MKDFKTFLAEKNVTAEDFTKKGAEEMAALYNEYNEKVRQTLAEAIEKKATKEDIDTLKAELSTSQVEQMKSLNEVLKQQGIAIKKLSEGEKQTGAANGVFASVRKSLEENREKLAGMKGNKQASLTIKAAGTMLLSTNVSGGNVPVEQRLDGLNTIASRRVRLMDIVSKRPAESNVISWVYQANKDGAAGGTGEGTLKNQIDFDLVVASETVKKFTAFIKLSEEMLSDVSFMEAEIRNELFREILKTVETQVYSGSGVGTNLNGIRTTATAFAAGTFAGTVDNANEADVLSVAANQIKLANHDMPNYILMNPSDVTKLKLIKASTTDRRYIDRLVMVAGQMNLDGTPIVETTLVTAGEYLIGNFDLAAVYDKGEVMIEIGRDSDDFTKNLVTVLAEWRGLVIVKNNDRTAFVKGVFATDKTALETP